MTLDIALQTVILLMNLATNILVTFKGSARRLGFIMGAVVQPLWLLENHYHHQYVLMIFSVINLGIWVNGIISAQKEGEQP